MGARVRVYEFVFHLFKCLMWPARFARPHKMLYGCCENMWRVVFSVFSSSNRYCRKEARRGKSNPRGVPSGGKRYSFLYTEMYLYIKYIMRLCGGHRGTWPPLDAPAQRISETTRALIKCERQRQASLKRAAGPGKTWRMYHSTRLHTTLTTLKPAKSGIFSGNNIIRNSAEQREVQSCCLAMLQY